MASADVAPPPQPTEPAPGVPDYLASPNAVFGDEGVQWRYGKPPDYSKTRKVWEEGKKMNHTAGSLPQLVENLVKNWEVEASFKPRLQDWRTIDHNNYTFAINGGPPQSAEHMLKVGTYNAIIAPNEYYDPKNSDFASSHKTFKRMMPTFAWEVLEVYSGPPTVAFKWRHWGEMKNDYVGFNDKGQKITAKAHGGAIDIVGITIATVDSSVRLQTVDTYFDPLEMFRQIAPHGTVTKETMNTKVSPSDALDITSLNNDGVQIAETHHSKTAHASEPDPHDIISPHISAATGRPADAFVPHQGADFSRKDSSHLSTNINNHPAQDLVQAAASQGTQANITHPSPNFSTSVNSPSTNTTSDSATVTTDATAASSTVNGNEAPAIPPTSESRATGTYDALDKHLEASADRVHPHPKDAEQNIRPQPGEAVAAPADSQETRMTHEEMSRLDSSTGECPFLMNRE